MDIACTIATTRRLGSTVRVDLDMNWQTTKRVAKVRPWKPKRKTPASQLDFLREKSLSIL